MFIFVYFHNLISILCSCVFFLLAEYRLIFILSSTYIYIYKFKSRTKNNSFYKKTTTKFTILKFLYFSDFRPISESEMFSINKWSWIFGWSENINDFDRNGICSFYLKSCGLLKYINSTKWSDWFGWDWYVVGNNEKMRSIYRNIYVIHNTVDSIAVEFISNAKCSIKYSLLCQFTIRILIF